MKKFFIFLILGLFLFVGEVKAEQIICACQTIISSQKTAEQELKSTGKSSIAPSFDCKQVDTGTSTNYQLSCRDQATDNVQCDVVGTVANNSQATCDILMEQFVDKWKIILEQAKAESRGVAGCYCKLGGTTEKYLLPGVAQETCVEYAAQSGATFEGQELSECIYNISGKVELIKSVAKENILEVPSEIKNLDKLGTVDIPALIGRFIKVVIRVIGTIALLMFVYGGILWMISAGSAEKTKKALDIMLWSSLGVIVILASYAIVNFVFGLL